MFSNSRKPPVPPVYSEQTSIALWGPTGAGKDWLICSFIKELDHFNRTDHEFYYGIYENQPGMADPTPLAPDVPSQTPTVRPDDRNLNFRRTALVQDAAHKNSTQAHDLVIHNDSGGNLVDSLNDRDSFERTFQTLIHANNIILVLGIPLDRFQSHPQVQQPINKDDSELSLVAPDYQPLQPMFNDDLHSPEANRPDWTPEEYLKFLQLLFAVLGPERRRNLAVCMTKSDQMSFRGDPIQIFRSRYGEALYRLVEVNRQRHNIEVFATSSAGFFKQAGRTMPNFQNGNLRDPSRWQPVNTAAPFFWIFEQIEKERMNKTPAVLRDSIYIRYPKPRVF